MQRRSIAAIAVLAMLGGCEARIGKEADKESRKEAHTGAPAGSPAAAGKSEEGSLSIDAPGFDMKISIPQGMSDRMNVEGDGDIALMYPGSQVAGLHVEARTGAKNSGVEIRFRSNDPPATIAGWYRDPARATRISIASAREANGVFTLAGADKDDGDRFTVQLSPRPGGGTDGRLTIDDSR
jgi:hypothetical protein